MMQRPSKKVFKMSECSWRRDDAAKRIMEIANERECGLLLMGSRGTGGLKELLLGSVSHKIANHSDRPVLIVK
jgi:nucleotide-binding universal stress UspA family protein